MPSGFALPDEPDSGTHKSFSPKTLSLMQTVLGVILPVIEELSSKQLPPCARLTTSQPCSVASGGLTPTAPVKGSGNALVSYWRWPVL